MAIYREILTFQNVEEIYHLFDMIEAAKLPDKVAQISAYLRDGYRYASNVKDDRVKQWDVTRHTDLIHLLHRCSVEMLKPEETRFMALHLDDGTVINLEAFFDFLETIDSLSEAVDDLQELDRVLQNYLNESNIWQYRECSATVREMLYMLDRLDQFIKNQVATH